MHAQTQFVFEPQKCTM